ncbi:hypothetical protein [Aneurinibacillus tyrosinisolvens]|uniref:hypothetical protein n=1 Tax=Aneurinibacillus tyrosinisolvens TaxID=1443435 RepID=UPI00063FB47C|nr:hypothetical protein [Aneurinibacillus tyrosinisolvens]
MEENEKRIGLGSTRIYGYIYNEEGRSPAIQLELDTKQLASFLLRTKTAHKVTFRNHLDGLELSTLPDSNGLIDYCADQDFLGKLQPLLLLMQHGELELEDVIIYSWGVPKETLEYVGGETGMRNWINDMFNVNL